MEINSEKNSLRGKRMPSFLRKNWFTILLVGVLILLIASPDAKSWVIRQVMKTGVFNANIENKTEASNGKEANFNFTDEQGNSFNTASLRGRVVFINVWASWCPPCRAEFPSIKSLYEKLKGNPEIFFLFLNEDEDIEAAKEFLKKENYNFPLYRISNGITDEIYKGTLPTTVVLDKAGKIRFHHEGVANYATDNFMDELLELLKE